MADLCLDYEIFDVLLWNNVLFELQKKGRHAELVHILTTISGVPRLWQVITTFVSCIINLNYYYYFYYIYIYMCIYIYIYICIYICIYIYMCVCVCIYIYIYIFYGITNPSTILQSCRGFGLSIMTSLHIV